MSKDKLVNAVEDNPDLFVQKFIKDYFSPQVAISREKAVELKDAIENGLTELDNDSELGSVYIGNFSTMQIGGPDQIGIAVVETDRIRR